MLLPYAAGDLSMTPGLASGEGKGYPFQYSDLRNCTGCIVHGVTESDTTEQFSLHPVYNRFNFLLEPHPQDGRENN